MMTNDENRQYIAGMRAAILLQHLFRYGYVPSNHEEHARDILIDCYANNVLDFAQLSSTQAAT